MGTEATVTQADERSPAQFFFEMGFGACYAEAMIRHGNKAPFALSDAEIERQWTISREAYDDPAELDAMLARTAASQASDAGAFDLVEIDAVISEMIDCATQRGEWSDEQPPEAGDVDLWQSRLQSATGHLHGFPSRATLTAPPTSDAGEIEDIARRAMRNAEVARTDVVRPVNGSAPYSVVIFHGQRTEFHDDEWTIEQKRDAGSSKAAAYAKSINDALFEIAKNAVLATLTAPPTSIEPVQKVHELTSGEEMRLVPVEPTEAMYLAAFSSDHWGGVQPIRRVVDEIWSSMLRAALTKGAE